MEIFFLSKRTELSRFFLNLYSVFSQFESFFCNLENLALLVYRCRFFKHIKCCIEGAAAEALGQEEAGQRLDKPRLSENAGECIKHKNNCITNG